MAPTPARTTRRRGSALTGAIYLATLTELAETSFEELSFDRIALRAGAGKASLYRRWSTTTELLLEALADPSDGLGEIVEPETGSVRSDLLALHREFARALDLPAGRALRPLMTQRPRHPELFDEVSRLIVQPRIEVALRILRSGADRGEVAARAVTMRIAEVGLRLIITEHIRRGTVSRAEVEAIVADVLMPLVAAVRPY